MMLDASPKISWRKNINFAGNAPAKLKFVKAFQCLNVSYYTHKISFFRQLLVHYKLFPRTYKLEYERYYSNLVCYITGGKSLNLHNYICNLKDCFFIFSLVCILRGLLIMKDAKETHTFTLCFSIVHYVLSLTACS